jgi:hypothetical protein
MNTIKDLINAITRVDFRGVKNIVEQNPGVINMSYYGEYPLINASSAGHLRMVMYLHEHGANINQQDSNGNTALITAIRNDFRDSNLGIVKYLVEQGADLNITNNSNQSVNNPQSVITPNETGRGIIEFMDYAGRIQEQQDQEAREQQRRLRSGEVSAEELFSEFHDDYKYDKPAKKNPNPLNVVMDLSILNKPITSYVYPGLCQICLEEDRSKLCRVNCRVGHVFHCKCINEYREGYTVYGWNNKCPVCREETIDKMVRLTPNIASSLPTEFGKRKNVLKKVESEIKYLQKL